MKPSSRWSSSGHGLFSLRRLLLLVRPVTRTILLCTVMSACASPEPIPPHFDAIERIPIHTVLVQGQRIAYLDVGEGEPVILIHGFGGSMWQWEHQQRALAAHARVITPDLLGSGLSDKPEIEYRPDQMLEFFVNFMDTLRIPQATLIGNSMGAGLALGMALTHPARVRRLVLIDGLPPGVLDKLASPTVKRALDTPAPAWLVSLGNRLFGGLMTESVLKEVVYDPSLLTPAVIDRSNRNRRRPGLMPPLLTARKNLAVWESMFAPRLGSVTHPTLILWGEEDRVFPPAVGEELHRIIKSSSLVRVPRAGHIPQWEQPAICNAAVVKFLQQSP